MILKIPNPDYVNSFGLINARLEDKDAENSPLWSLQFIELEFHSDTSMNLYTYIDDCRIKPGLYNQSPKWYGKHDDYMSPDQLIAFILFNRRYRGEVGKQENKEIWWYLLTHFFTYNNVTGKTDFDRTMQPMAIALAAVCGGSWFSKLFWYPVLVGTLLFSCKYDDAKTSGPLKSWTILKVMSNMTWTAKRCTKHIADNPYKTWEGNFIEYFKEKYQPNRQLIDKGISCEL